MLMFSHIFKLRMKLKQNLMLNIMINNNFSEIKMYVEIKYVYLNDIFKCKLELKTFNIRERMKDF